MALLAALSRTQSDSNLYTRMENSCSGRESIRFDAVKIKLLTDARPSFSYLQALPHFLLRQTSCGARKSVENAQES